MSSEARCGDRVASRERQDQQADAAAEQAEGAGPDVLVDGHEGGQRPGDEEEQCAEVEQIGGFTAGQARGMRSHMPAMTPSRVLAMAGRVESRPSGS